MRVTLHETKIPSPDLWLLRSAEDTVHPAYHLECVVVCVCVSSRLVQKQTTVAVSLDLMSHDFQNTPPTLPKKRTLKLV